MPERSPMEHAYDAHQSAEDEKAEAKSAARREKLETATRHSFEFRDGAGRNGRFELTLGRETHVMVDTRPRKVEGKELLEWTLHGEKDGQPTTVDVLAEALAEDVAIVATTDRKAAYHHVKDDPELGHAILVPLPTNRDEAAVVLHELGHARQFKDPRFDKLTPLYGQRFGVDAFHEEVEWTLTVLGDAIPEGLPLRDREGMAEAMEVEDELDELEADLEEAVEDRNGAAINEAQDAIAELQSELSRMLSEAFAGSENAKAIAALPRVMMERDATYRALRVLRRLSEKSGLDLLSPAPRADGEGDPQWDDRVAALLFRKKPGKRRGNDPVGLLRDSLDTYDARTAPRRRMRGIAKDIAAADDAGEEPRDSEATAADDDNATE